MRSGGNGSSLFIISLRGRVAMGVALPLSLELWGVYFRCSMIRLAFGMILILGWLLIRGPLTIAFAWLLSCEF
jgi:hypothetical protein